jgi:hypothetical protein
MQERSVLLARLQESRHQDAQESVRKSRTGVHEDRGCEDGEQVGADQGRA